MAIPALLPTEQTFAAMGDDYRLAAALATWGMLLRDSDFTEPKDWTIVEAVARAQLSNPQATELLTQWSELVSQSNVILNSPPVAKQ